MPRDSIIALAVLGAGVIAIAALVGWWTWGQRHGPTAANGRWKHLPLYYALLLSVVIACTAIGVTLFLV